MPARPEPGELLATDDHIRDGSDQDGTDTRVTDHAGDLAGRVLARSVLARAWRVGTVEIDHELARSIALLAVAGAEPLLLRRGDAAAVLHAAANALRAAPARSGSGLVVPRPGGAERPDSVTDTDARQQAHHLPAQSPVETRVVPIAAEDLSHTPHGGESAPIAQPPVRDDADDGPRTPAAVEESPLGVATVLGGLVHLLATADAAGVPDDLMADPALGDLLPSAVLRLLLVEMADGEEPADPMFEALSGLRRKSRCRCFRSRPARRCDARPTGGVG